eukprot:68981_1
MPSSTDIKSLLSRESMHIIIRHCYEVLVIKESKKINAHILERDYLFVAESLVRRETICDNKQRDIIRVILVISNREITIQRDDFLQQTERYYPCKDRRYFLQRATDIGYQRETD